MRRAWADLERAVADWNARLEQEGLGVISVGSDERGHGRKDIISLTPAIETRVTGSVWELSATVDSLVDALGSCRFDNVVDGQICEMLSRRIAWHRIARTLRCSKRRIVRVSRLVAVWREQAMEKRRNQGRVDELIERSR